jgi:hypothetical protein
MQLIRCCPIKSVIAGDKVDDLAALLGKRLEGNQPIDFGLHSDMPLNTCRYKLIATVLKKLARVGAVSHTE